MFSIMARTARCCSEEKAEHKPDDTTMMGRRPQDVKAKMRGDGVMRTLGVGNRKR